MRVVLINTYELGQQPFGIASPAAWLKRAGASVECLDLSRQALAEEAIQSADFIGFYVPMHTATRLALQVLPRIRDLNPRAHIAFYGLYAPVNESYLRSLGVETILGGEFEAGLVSAVRRLAEGGSRRQSEPVISLDRLPFIAPDRNTLPTLARYAHLNHPDGRPRVVGYTEASRGCKHLCRHCPIVPIYGGVFRIVPREVVLQDIRQQIAAGAEHITFGDPDFFNGIRHAVELVRALHAEFPHLTYDVTVKIEHLLRHSEHLSTLRETGCILVTSAAEAVDDAILEKLAKEHSLADFVAVIKLCREVSLSLSPTFVAFTPWTTLEGYRNFLEWIQELDLIEQVSPIQLAIRLLIPAGSRLLELEEIRCLVQPFDDEALVYPWQSPYVGVDALAQEVLNIVEEGEKRRLSRRQIFNEVWERTHRTLGLPAPRLPVMPDLVSPAAIPYLTEPWYC